MNELKQKALATVDANAQLYNNISDSIWDKPELSLKEHFAADTYCDALEKLGFTVERGICGIDTAFSGTFGAGKPIIGILGEYDALSGLSQVCGDTAHNPVIEGASGHGCGHNMLGAGSLAAAVAVKEYLQLTGKPGTVIYYGCPGEEGGAGKAYMARDGLWYGLDAALCWHPGDTNENSTGTNNSCIQVLYKFSGVPAHAAGDPYNGRSALDAVELMNIGVQFLREHTTSDCRIHYAITDAGGVSPNVVQSKADVLYMVRANKVADSVKLQARVDDIAKGAALMTGTTYERVFIDGTAETLPNYTLEKLMHDCFAEVGVPEHTAEELDFAAALKATYPQPAYLPGTGANFSPEIAKEVKALQAECAKPMNDFLMPYYSGECFVPGSTDVGDVSWQTPTAQIYVAAWPAGTPGHSWQVVSCGKTALAHKALATAGKVLASAAIELIDNAELLKKAQAEHAERSASGYVCPIEPDAKPIAI